MQPDYFKTLARYNAWANIRLYGACSQLAPEELTRARPAFFGSILATFNHLQVGDWLSRITHEPDPEIIGLDQILHDDFDELAKARASLDTRIIDIVSGLSPERIAGDLHYATLAGQTQSTPLILVLGHLFNHQTHHRGQVHGLLSGTTIAPPPLDLIQFLREPA